MRKLMSDYGLLEALREVLCLNDTLKNAGIHQRIYFKLPPKPTYPCLLLEIDSMWEDENAGSNQAVARIDFRVTLMTQAHMSNSSSIIRETVDNLIDAHSLRLSCEFLANFRKTGNVIDLPMVKSPRTFQQFYQAIVWKKEDRCNMG